MVGPHGVTDVSPAGSVLSFRRPLEKFDSDVIQNFCRYVLFFSPDEAGRQWTSRREDAFLLSLQDGFELGRLLVRGRFGLVLDAQAPTIPARGASRS